MSARTLQLLTGLVAGAVLVAAGYVAGFVSGWVVKAAAAEVRR